jgi:predicted nucleic-acid-binding protein
MKITADTNVLVRAITGDDEQQGKVAQAELASAAGALRVGLSAVAGLRNPFGRNSGSDPTPDERRECRDDRPAVEAGLAMLDAGGDFADGIIAYEGSWLGAEIFISFDKKAVKLMEARGEPVRLLS